MHGAYRDVDNQDSNVTQRTSTGSQVGERLVTRGVNNQQTRNLEVEFAILKLVLYNQPHAGNERDPSD